MALDKQISNVTGLDSAYEIPKSPDLHLLTHKNDIDACIDEIMQYLVGNEYANYENPVLS